jgi:hypothetical protein
MNNLKASQSDEAPVVLNQLVGIKRRKPFRVQEEILFDLIADYLRQHQPADLRGAERQRGLIESPGGDNSCGQNVRVEKQTDSALTGHFPRRFRKWRRKVLAEGFFPKRRA